MTITNGEISAQLTAAFLQRRTETGPCEDAVWSRVQTIALHCLGTGVCILTCTDPDETKYRQIPSGKLEELRAALTGHEENAWEEVIQSMIEVIYTSPNTYYPDPFQILSYDLSRANNSLFTTTFASFAPYRKTYQVDDSGFPNTPGGVLDVIVEGTELKVLIKGEDENAIGNFNVYLESLPSKIDSYMRIFDELHMPILVGGRIPLTTIWLLKATLMGPHCFIEEFCEEMVKLLPEDKQRTADQFHKGFQELCTEVRENRWQSRLQTS